MQYVHVLHNSVAYPKSSLKERKKNSTFQRFSTMWYFWRNSQEIPLERCSHQLACQSLQFLMQLVKYLGNLRTGLEKLKEDEMKVIRKILRILVKKWAFDGNAPNISKATRINRDDTKKRTFYWIISLPNTHMHPKQEGFCPVQKNCSGYLLWSWCFFMAWLTKGSRI